MILYLWRTCAHSGPIRFHIAALWPMQSATLHRECKFLPPSRRMNPGIKVQSRNFYSRLLFGEHLIAKMSLQATFGCQGLQFDANIAKYGCTEPENGIYEHKSSHFIEALLQRSKICIPAYQPPSTVRKRTPHDGIRKKNQRKPVYTHKGKWSTT